MKRATVQCLHKMTTHGDEFWRPLLETGSLRLIQLYTSLEFMLFFSLLFWTDGIKRLVKLLKINDAGLILSTLSVLCNISTHTEVRLAISSAEADLSDMFSNLLKINNDEIRSKTSVLIADICFIPANQVF